ncbi:hypothetical protein [Streptacidiphilus carbonis]|uniref:hypothetical protein n=1 Tax=Streptacidiphilus carbonis TaxID=105422 RepID=UPI0005A943A8|nr:hypothetical protein [Streptacidiphilus carbonis]
MSTPVETLASAPEPGPQGRLGPIGRARASLTAIEVLQRLREDQGTPTADDLAALRQWPGWGPLAPALSDGREGTWAEIGEQLQLLLSPRAYRQAEQGTSTAFYTPDLIVEACWTGLRDLNFRGGRILEPGCGAGTFIRHTPDRMNVEWFGVERDPTTAGIAALLHPDAQIINARLQEAGIQSNSVDAFLANVPYGNFQVHDKTAPKAVTDSIHNYFIWRSVQALRPGGVGIVLTSRYTMDSGDDSARRAIAQHADLLGAIRLPNGALADGGTGVLADILIVRRRDTDGPLDESWMDVSDVPGIAGQYVNNYFLAHPENVLGEFEKGRAGQYGHTLAVKAPEGQNLAAALSRSFDGITAAARDAGRDWRVAVGAQPFTADTLPFPVRGDGRKEGSFHLVDGVPHEVVDGELVAVARAGKELPKLIALRDATLALIEAETDHDSLDARLDPLRAEVNRLYDAYARAHGPINRFTLAEGQVDEETGEQAVSRRYPRLGGFRRDPDVVSVLALENFDDETQTAEKASLLLRRVNRRIERPTSAQTPEEALSLCLNFKNTVDVPTIAQLLGIEEDQVQAALGELVFPDPDTADLLPRGTYLSGPVVDKLERVEFLLSQGRDDLQRHVDALRQVQPEPLPPEDIKAKLGVPWIPVEDVAAFAQELLGVRVEILYVAKTSTWSVDMPMMTTEAATSEWGTARVSAFELLDLALNGQAPKVYDTYRLAGGGSQRVRNDKETMLAESKMTALTRRFASWVWEDPDRADRLAADYNRIFNSTVLPKHDGSHLTVDGMDPEFTPYEHQWDFVQRVLSAEEGSLCPYPVGAGKTATMFMTALKLKQLGLVNKPMIVVPNHLLEQISRDGKKLFPNAKILMAGKKDLADARSRMLFAARCATGDWDAIVMTHNAFGRLGVHPVTEATYLEELANEYRVALSAIDGDDGNQRRIKEIAKMVDRFDARAADLRSNSTDAGVTFENLGVDFLQVDEAHLFKNLALPATTEGMSLGKPSKRATDLDLKLIVTRERTGRDNVTALYSGTFISNSVREMYVFKHYTMPKRLEKMGMGSPDAWAANFIQFESRPEVGVDGVSFRLKRRPVEYTNADEALAMFAQVAELRPREEFKIKRPRRVDRFVEIEATPNLIQYVGSISDRIDLIQSGKVKPYEDNMLNIITDGRKAAIDLELVGMEPDGPGKAGAIIKNVLQIHERTKDLKLPGDPDDVSGGLQLIFCDLGTPSKERGTQVYGKVRRGLIEGLPQEGLPGIPRERIRFIHDYKSDLAKEQLFTDARAGKVSVLFMSSETGGTGVNVQTRGVALHHADPPHKPAEWEQREGRLDRPGNLLINLDMEVEFLRYLALNSFDSYMFQQLERKQRPIVQIMSGRKVGRVIQEIDPVGAGFGQAKAIIAGNPMLMELADANGELTVLLNEADGHRQAQARMKRKVEVLSEQISEAQSTLPGIRAMADAVIAAGEDDTWRTADGRLIDPDDVPSVLAQTVQGSKPTLDLDAGYLWRGLNVGLTWHRQRQFGAVAYEAWAHLVAGGHQVDVRVNLPWLGKGQAWRIVKALGEAADAAVTAPVEIEQQVIKQQAALEDTRSHIGRPFEKRDQLEAVRERKASLEARIADSAVASGNEGGSGPQFEPGAAGAEMTEADMAMHDAAATAGMLGGTAVVLNGGQVIGGARRVDAPGTAEPTMSDAPPAPEMAEIAAILRYYEPLFQRHRLTGTAAAADYVTRPGYGYAYDPGNPLHDLVARMGSMADRLAGIYPNGHGVDGWVMYHVGLPRLEASTQLQDVAITLTNRLTFTGGAVGSVDLDAILTAPPGTVIDLPPLPERTATPPTAQDSPYTQAQQAPAQTQPSPDSAPTQEGPAAPAADSPSAPGESTLDAPAAQRAPDGQPAPTTAAAPSGPSASSSEPTPLGGLIGAFGDRVMIGHIGPQPARTHQSAGWAITAVLSESQVRALVSAVVVDAQPVGSEPGAAPTDSVREWIAEQKQRPTAAFYASTSSELPPGMRGDGDVSLSARADGLTVEQGGVSTTISWEELPAWIDAAVAYDTVNRSMSPPTWRYGALDNEIHIRFYEHNEFATFALDALAEALRETTPPTDEQLAEARARFAPPAAPERTTDPTEDTPAEESAPQESPQQLPEGAKPVPGAEGYHYTEEGRTVLLYLEPGEQVGAARWSYSKYRYEGDVRGDMVRGTEDGATIARRMANHHAVVYGDRAHRPPLDDQGRDPVWILHNGSDTLVFGVRPEDDTVRAAMWTGGGFKDSRKAGGWYLPRTWKEPTRKERVDTAVRVLAAAGRTVTVYTSRQDRQLPPEQPARLPELNVVVPELDEVPQFFDAAPFTDQDDLRDVERLESAYERWSQHPTVVAYLQQDNDARPNGFGDPDNPVAELQGAYLRALSALREPVPGGPEEIVRRIHGVAAWCQALEPVVDTDLLDPLQDVYTAAHLLAARSQATLAVLAAEQAATADQVPAPALETEAEAPAVDQPLEPAPAPDESAPGAAAEEQQQQGAVEPQDEPAAAEAAAAGPGPEPREDDTVLEDARPEESLSPEPVTPAPDPALTATAGAGPTAPTPDRAGAQEDGQLDLFPGEPRESPAPARRRTSVNEPASHPGAEGGPEDGHLGVYGHAGHGECDRCGTAEDRYTLVWAWPSRTEDGGTMAAECGSCVVLTTGLPPEEHRRLADAAEARRGGRRIVPRPYAQGDVAGGTLTADNEWTYVHQPTGKRYRLAQETPSGYRGFVMRDLAGISQGTGVSTSSGYELAERAALGRTAQTHPNSSDSWVLSRYDSAVGTLAFNKGESISSDHPDSLRSAGPFEHGPRWDITIGITGYQVEMVYQQGLPGDDGHRLEVTAPNGTSTRHVQWDGALAWAREQAGAPEQAAAPLAALAEAEEALFAAPAPKAPDSPAALLETVASDSASAGESNGWGLAEGEEITYTGQFDGRYEITLPGGISYLMFLPSIEYRRTQYAVSLNDQSPGITPKRLRRFQDPDEIMPWVRRHASTRQTGYLFQDGAWIENSPTIGPEPLATDATAEEGQLPFLPADTLAPDTATEAGRSDIDAPSAKAAAPNDVPPPARAGQAPDQYNQEEAVAAKPEPASATTDAPAVDPLVEDLPAEALAEEAPESAVNVEDPPAPRSSTETIPLPADARYQLRLTSVDAEDPVEGELRYGETTIATLRRSSLGRWFARMTAEGLPSDVTELSSTPQDAAHQGAVMFAVLTGEPYGAPPVAAEARGPLSRADMLRFDLRTAAEQHLRSITLAAARAHPNYLQNPQFQALSEQLGKLGAAVADTHNSGQMTANLTAVQEAANAWGSALPADTALDERQHLAFPLLDLLYDTARLHGRLQATLEAVQADRAAAAAREAAAAVAAPVEPAREDRAQQAPPSVPAPAPAAQPEAAPALVPVPDPAPAAEPVRGPLVSLSLRRGVDGQVILGVETVEAAQALVLPGITVADVPGQDLPTTVDVPVLVRPARRAETLVSQEETETWLAAVLADGPLAPAWNAANVRVLLVVAVRDTLRDGMAPSVDDVAVWVAEAAAQQDGLLLAANTAADLEEFGPMFAQAADSLMAFSDDEHMAWTYFGQERARRDQVLALATPIAYEQLLALPTPADAPGPEQVTDVTTTDLPAPLPDAPEDPEMATTTRPASPETPEATGPAPAADSGEDQPAPATAAPAAAGVEPAGDLPLWTGPQESADPQEEDRPVDVVADFAAVQEAWDEHVPADQGTGEDLFVSVEDSLRRLEALLADAVAKAHPIPEPSPVPAAESVPAPEVPAAAAEPEAPAAAPTTAEPETAGSDRDPAPAAAAAAVNTALRDADQHAPALQDLPEWQRIQSVRGAFGHLMTVMRERAGERFDQLMADSRVADYVRRVSIRVCEKVAGWAQGAADRLRRTEEHTTDERGELPSAEALLRLGNAAIQYSGAPRGDGGTPTRPAASAVEPVNIPALRKMGEALNRPMPANRGVSTAAARGRSTTTAKRGGKKARTEGAEQPGHLRRGPEQSQTRKPNQR